MKNYKYVNPRMGSDSAFDYSNGNCYPACAVPHGLNFFSIQTNDKSHWFYNPKSQSFQGIRLTHMPSPWLGDYGKLLICAEGEDSSSADAIYDNEGAVFEPSYIKAFVYNKDYTVEVTPSDTCAMLHFTFGKSGKHKIVIIPTDFEYKYDLKSGALVITTTQADTRYKIPASGKKLTEYIVIKPDTQEDISLKDGKIFLSFEGSEIYLKLATSFISESQAYLNYSREIHKKGFDEIRCAATALWNEILDKIEIEDPDEERIRVFFSCLYRAFLWPRKFYESDSSGAPVHINTETFEPRAGYLYTDQGFWDTYRTLYPFLSLIDTDLYREAAEGFLNYYKDTGWLPKWVCPTNVSCMPGMLIEATMGDAIVKEIVTGDLAQNIFLAMLKDGESASDIPGEGRTAAKEYREYGYIPYTKAKESVNETLDNSYGDFCIAMAAKKLGYKDIAEKYFEYSKNYKNLFDPEVGFIRGKDEGGNFRNEEFNPFAWGRDYTEGSVWQNGFGVYHDIKGLDSLYDGKLSKKIDELISCPPTYDVGGYGKVIHEMEEMAKLNYGQLAISNQPSFHIPFIYSELGEPEKTSLHIRELLTRFTSDIDGYPGDEDNGSMSCWFMLSAMGLYPMAPSRPDFATAVPYFDKMTVTLAGGKKLSIIKKDYSVEKMSGSVSYFDVMAGGSLAEMVGKSK